MSACLRSHEDSLRIERGRTVPITGAIAGVSETDHDRHLQVIRSRAFGSWRRRRHLGRSRGCRRHWGVSCGRPTRFISGARLRTCQKRTARPRQVERLEERVLLSTFTVTDVLDDGNPGSLRWAINQVNADKAKGVDTIDFDIAGTGPFVIAPTSALPTITHRVVIDGYSQPVPAPTRSPPAIMPSSSLS